MSRDDIIRMAREAGVETVLPAPLGQVESIERFANLVAAAEREACAKWLRDNYQDYKNIADICEAIRARGQA